MTPLDHIVALLLALGLPVYALAMAFHALIDLNSGFLGWLAFRREDRG